MLVNYQIHDVCMKWNGPACSPAILTRQYRAIRLEQDRRNVTTSCYRKDMSKREGVAHEQPQREGTDATRCEASAASTLAIASEQHANSRQSPHLSWGFRSRRASAVTLHRREY